MEEKQTLKEKKKKNKTFFVKFRVNYDTYRLLQLKSLENKMGNRPHRYARKLVEDDLILNDSKLIKKSLLTINEDVHKNRRLIIQIMKWTEYFTQSFFANVPEIPEENKSKVGETAQRRMRKFFEIMTSIELGKGDTVIEDIIADLIDKNTDK